MRNVALLNTRLAMMLSFLVAGTVPTESDFAANTGGDILRTTIAGQAATGVQ